MFAYVRTNINIYIHKRIHIHTCNACIDTYIQCMHTYIHTYMHRSILRLCIHTYYIYTYINIYSYMCTCEHTGLNIINLHIICIIGTYTACNEIHKHTFMLSIIYYCIIVSITVCTDYIFQPLLRAWSRGLAERL